MVTEIRIYVEGGGDGKETRAKVRQGLSEFLKDIVALAREKRINWNIIACGSRNSTFDNFQTALRTHPEDFNVLLVDADGPVNTNTNPRQHLQNRDGWNLSAIDDERCQLMVQTTEAWIIGDIDALRTFYGQGFNSNSISNNPDVEKIDKDMLYSSLKSATRMTQKGEYHKIRHGPDILKLVDVSRVRSAAAHCNRLFETLEEKIGT